MLILDDVTFSYPGRETALRSITLEIPAGVTLVVGPNGGGKTTLLRLLAGLFDKFSGTVVLKESGRPLNPADLRKISRMVMQDADAQILGASVREDIELGRAASGLGADFDEKARNLSQQFGLLDLWNEPVTALSYGQKRKLSLLHALLAGPGLLLLDEPFAGLDYPSAVELHAIIKANAGRGLTQVVSTHEVEPLVGIADEIVVIADGRAAARGSPGEVVPELPRWSVRAPGQKWA